MKQPLARRWPLLGRILCLLSGGHRRWEFRGNTIVVTLLKDVSGIEPGTQIRHCYEPCRKCGRLFLHESVIEPIPEIEKLTKALAEVVLKV